MWWVEGGSAAKCGEGHNVMYRVCKKEVFDIPTTVE